MKSLTRRKIKSSNVQKDKGPPGKPRKKPVITKETFEKMMGQVRSLADAAELVKKTMNTGSIRVASDCTGLGSEIIALALLGLLPKLESVCWSETDEDKKNLYRCICAQLKHEVGTLEMDMTERSLVLGGCTSKPRNIDLYVAGYPCPSFSALGRKRGGLDPRGVVTLHGSQWIIKEQPKACILENVAGLLHVKLSNPCAPILIRHCCFSWKRLWKASCKQTWRSAIF